MGCCTITSNAESTSRIRGSKKRLYQLRDTIRDNSNGGTLEEERRVSSSSMNATEYSYFVSIYLRNVECRVEPVQLNFVSVLMRCQTLPNLLTTLMSFGINIKKQIQALLPTILAKKFLGDEELLQNPISELHLAMICYLIKISYS